MQAGLEEEVAKDARVLRTRSSANWLLIVVAVIAIVLLGAGLALVYAWPFTEANMIKQLEDATSSHVEIGAFHRTYFPHPGCMADRVIFKRGSNPEKQAVMRVERITIVGSFLGLITKHLTLIELRGAHATFPP
jgi:hypothetical protein